MKRAWRFSRGLICVTLWALALPSDSYRERKPATKEDVMPAVEAVIVAAIVTAFVIFAGVLAWAEHQTRDLPPR